jgi:hypothetical protein
MHGGRVKHALDGDSGLGIDGQRIIAECLHDVESRPVGTPVLVYRH